MSTYMKTETGGVAVGKDPCDGPVAVEGELGDIVHKLLEEGDEVDGVGGRAVTGAAGERVSARLPVGTTVEDMNSLDSLDGVCHVRAVALEEVHSIPARREHDLGAHAVRAVVVEEGGPVLPLWVALVSTSVHPDHPSATRSPAPHPDTEQRTHSLGRQS